MSSNGKMLDHDDDSLENINILRMLINLYLQNVKRYLRIFLTMQVAWWQDSTIQCQYLFRIISSLYLPCLPSFLVCSFFSIKKFGPRCYIRLLNMTLSFGRWVEESQYLITLEYFWYFCQDVISLKNCYIFFVGLC